MKNFEIHYTSHLTIEAESYDDAVKKFHETHFIPDQVTEVHDVSNAFINPNTDSKEVYGYCEDCELPIFIDDECEVNNEDGIMVHTRCVDPEDLARPSNENGQEEV